MPLPWTQEQAARLKDQGSITEAQYQAAYPDPIGLSPMELPPVGPELPPVGLEGVPSEEVSAPLELGLGGLSPSMAPAGTEAPLDEPGVIESGFSALTDKIKSGYNGVVDALKTVPSPPVYDPSSFQLDQSFQNPLESNPDQSAELTTGAPAPLGELVRTPAQLQADADALAKAENAKAAKEANAMMAPYDTLMASAKLSEMTGMARAAEESAYLKRMQKDQDEKLKAQIEWDESQREELETKLSQLDRQADDLMNQKIVEKDFWADKSTAQKIMGGVALFLGAVGAARTGSNSAVKVIEDAISRDLDTQRLNIDQKNKAFNAKSGIYASSFSMFKDHAAAKEAARVQGFEIAKIGISEMAARYKGPEVKAQAMNLMGQIELKKAESRFKLGEIMRQRQLMANLSSGKGMNPLLMPEKMRESYVPGYGFGYNNETVKKLNQEIIPKHDTSVRVIDNLIRISKLQGLGKISPKALAEANIDMKFLQGQIREIIVGPGTLSESDKKDLTEVVGDPTKIFQYTKSTDKLNALKRRVNDSFDDVMSRNVHGYQSRSKKFDEQPLTLGGGK